MHPLENSENIAISRRINESIHNIDKEAQSIVFGSKEIIILPTLQPLPDFRSILINEFYNQEEEKTKYLLGNMSLQRKSNIKLDSLGLSGNLQDLESFVASDDLYKLIYKIFEFKFSSFRGVVKPTTNHDRAVILPHFAHSIGPNPQLLPDEAALFVPFVNPQKGTPVFNYHISNLRS